jgi:uncharacterized membrane protein YgdD (TMEM256/DUF423 family)
VKKKKSWNPMPERWWQNWCLFWLLHACALLVVNILNITPGNMCAWIADVITPGRNLQ